jgi:hypothetical protein
MQHIRGITLIEALLGFAGLGILLLMIYTLFLGGMKSWTTMTPQINARKVAREILYGKTGEEWGGMVGEIRECNMKITPNSPSVGISQVITTSRTALNLLTYYDTGTLVGTFAICYEWSGDPSGYNLYNSVSNIGTLTKIIWQLPPGTTTGWKLKSKEVLANNMRMGYCSYSTFGTYPLFKYYTGLGIEKYDNPTTSVNELLDAINGEEIRQISISMVFDIDADKDGKFGEDPVDKTDNDFPNGDRRIDEDRPNDFTINTRVSCMNLDRYDHQHISIQ